jgi:hypothetical protein
MRLFELLNNIHVFISYPEGIESRNAPFPLAMTFIIAGTVAWAFFYILFMGMFQVVI